MPAEDYIERILIDEYRVINRHAPYRRRSLKELLSMEIPEVVLRDGTRHMVRREELRFLASILEEKDYPRLMIPIVLEVNPKYGAGAVVIRDPLAARVIAQILGLKEHSVPLIIYRPQLSIVREKLRTTTTILFMPG